MSNPHYTTAITVDQPAKEALMPSITSAGGGQKEIEGRTDKLGDEFTYRYKNIHSCKMKLVEVIPNKKVVWLVSDNYFNFTEDKTEWKDTKIVFDVSEKGGKAEIRFTHLGLVLEYECFNVCSNAWGSYKRQSAESDCHR